MSIIVPGEWERARGHDRCVADTPVVWQDWIESSV